MSARDVHEGRAFDERMRAAVERSQAKARRIGFVESVPSLIDARKLLPRGHLRAGADRRRSEFDPDRIVAYAFDPEGVTCPECRAQA